MTSIFSNIDPLASRLNLGNLTQTVVKWLQDNFDWAKTESNQRVVVLDVQTPNAGTPASLVETQLYGYTISGGNLVGAGYSIRARFFGTTSGNANNKTIRAYLGATKIFDSGVFSGASKDWVVDLLINLSGSAAEECIARGSINGNATLVQYTNAAVDFSVDQLIKFTGQNAVASAADLSLKGAQLEIGRMPGV